MDVVTWAYLAYITLTLTLTFWVARTLHRNGAVFLEDVLDGDKERAAAVNHLLTVGFWLVNTGYAAVQMRIGGDIATTRAAIEAVGTKIGAVLLVLGLVHLLNLWVLNKFRRGRRPETTPPATPPQPRWNPAAYSPAPHPAQ